MDVGILKAFLEIQRTRHFGRAANNLYISQSAISARIRQLENEIGTSLFSRSRHNIELTPAGKKFLHFAEQIIGTWNRAIQETAVPEGMESSLSMAALPSIWDAFLETWLTRVPRILPAIALQTASCHTDAILRQLLEGTVDLGILFDPPRMTHLLTQAVAPVPLMLVASRPGMEMKKALRDGYVLVNWGTSFISQHAQIFADMPSPRLRVDVGHQAYVYLMKNGGSAYLPEPMVRKVLGKKLFSVKGSPVISREAFAVYSQAGDKGKVIDTVLQSLGADL